MSTTFGFEGRRVPIEDGDTVASALHRDGLRTFNRSSKSHRRRGLYCMTGDCPNCLLNVDGMPATRACCTPASDGMTVKRETGRPSTDIDLLAVNDRMHRLMPVGFYYKTFIRPRFVWPVVEKIIRRSTGLGALPVDEAPSPKPSRHLHPDTLVVGAGIAGLAAALAAVERGERVLLCDEHAVGDTIAPGETLSRIDELHARVRTTDRISLFEHAIAVGVYEGNLVPIATPGELLQVHPTRLIVATGGAEAHAVFKGSDIPGVFLGRGAARLAGAHGVRPGERAVVATTTAEGIAHIETLQAAGVAIAAAIVPAALAGQVPSGIETIIDGDVIQASGRKQVRSVRVRTGADSAGARQERTIECDTLVAAVGISPRDGLLRMAAELEMSVVAVGDVITPGCTPEQAEAAGAEAGRGQAGADASVPNADMPEVPKHGYVCLCEDVQMEDLETALGEGFRSSEILKRYTTATMGPCQGSMCGRLLAAFAQQHTSSPAQGARTTPRPPTRTVTIDSFARAAHEVVEKRTALHQIHRDAGAKLERSGSWFRPYNYGDRSGEYRAVREGVGIMDVSTLGKFLIGGPDATELLNRVYPCRVDNLAPGQSRYALMLGEAGYVFDDGLICALADGRFFVTTTSGGASAAESWIRDWADRWGLQAFIADQTGALGAIVVAGPRSRELLQGLSDDDLSNGSFPYMAHRQITVAGTPCHVLRVGFLGELAYELHHPAGRSADLWQALLSAGAPMGIRPHGLDSLDLLRLEKGHIFIGQDTRPDSTPTKLGLDRSVASDKPQFIGKMALERMAELPLKYQLVGVAFEPGVPAPEPGGPMFDGTTITGRLTSCMDSPATGHGIGLAVAFAQDGELPTAFEAIGRRGGRVRATVVPTPFYDPEGAKLRA